MIKKIDASSKIFLSKDFMKDRNLFNIYIDDIKNMSAEIYSDEENYIIFRGKPNYPIWIWTRNGIKQEIVNEIEEAMNIYLDGDLRKRFTCKKELYDLLNGQSSKINPDDYFEMNFLICKDVKKPEECDGMIYTSTVLETDLLYSYYMEYLKEINQGQYLIFDKSYIENIIYDNGLYTWKDQSGKIVAMASYFEQNSQVRLGLIYTKPENRGKGYATNLIYELTSAILKEGLEPVVYVNNNYLPTSKIFSKIGYKSEGILVNFTASETNIKRVML